MDRPEDLLGYYLQTFSDISATTFVDEVPGFTPSESGTVLNVLPWHDVEQIDLLLPAARETATALKNLRTGRDVLADVRAAAGEDANLEVLTLSRERLASLEREWSLATSRAIGPSYVVVRSGVTLQAYPILHPADATVAVVAARARDGSVAIPDRAVIARPIDTAPGVLLTRGVLGPDLASGVLAVGPGAEFRLEVCGPGSSVRPPILETTVRVRSASDIRVQDVVPTFAAATPSAPLKPGAPAQVRLTVARSGCDVVSAAVSFSAIYPTPSPGVPESERGSPAVGMGRANAGLLFGFVPQGPGMIAPAVDYGLLQCSGQAQLIALLPSDPRAGGGVAVEVERLLKVSQPGPAALTGLAAGTREMKSELQFELASWRDEQIQFGIEGLPGATLTGGDLTVRPREGSPRPRPRGGALPVQVRLDRALPGGVSGSFTIVARAGALRRIGAIKGSLFEHPLRAIEWAWARLRGRGTDLDRLHAEADQRMRLEFESLARQVVSRGAAEVVSGLLGSRGQQRDRAVITRLETLLPSRKTEAELAARAIDAEIDEIRRRLQGRRSQTIADGHVVNDVPDATGEIAHDRVVRDLADLMRTDFMDGIRRRLLEVFGVTHSWQAADLNDELAARAVEVYSAWLTRTPERYGQEWHPAQAGRRANEDRAESRSPQLHARGAHPICVPICAGSSLPMRPRSCDATGRRSVRSRLFPPTHTRRATRSGSISIRRSMACRHRF
ncbi:MAG: hypothetical protein FJ033_16235 [Chloroflexi bacterium]|nr:hypothetical protein [Chloroflexota bacterium]